MPKSLDQTECYRLAGDGLTVIRLSEVYLTIQYEPKGVTGTGRMLEQRPSQAALTQAEAREAAAVLAYWAENGMLPSLEDLALQKLAKEQKELEKLRAAAKCLVCEEKIWNKVK